MLDFDEILVTINNPEIKKYLKESIRSYGVGNYRSAIIAVWIAAMFDLVKKFEILCDQQDEEVKKKWKDLKPLIEDHKNWENRLIESAASVAMISKYEEATLKQLCKMRNRYAHPSFDEVGSLFDPTPEEVRYFIRTLYDIVLSQPAQLGTFYIKRILEKIKESNFFEEEIKESAHILNQADSVAKTVNIINKRQVPRLVKSLFVELESSINSEHQSNILCFISNIWANNEAGSEIAIQISTHWNDYIASQQLKHTIVVEAIIAYPECLNQLSEKVQASIEKCMKDRLKQKAYLPYYSYANFLKYSDSVPVAKSVFDDLLTLIDIDEILKRYSYYQESLGAEIFTNTFGKSIYLKTREALKTGNGYIVNPRLDALCYCDIWKIADSCTEEEQKEFSIELIDSLNSNNFRTMSLLCFDNRNNIPTKWVKLLLDSWIEKILLKKHLQNILPVYAEHYLGLLDRYTTDIENHEKAGDTLKILVESLSSDLPLKSKLSIDDNEDAWRFLQEIMTKNKIVISNMV